MYLIELDFKTPLVVTILLESKNWDSTFWFRLTISNPGLKSQSSKSLKS